MPLCQSFYTIAIQYIWKSSGPRLFFGLLFLTDPSFSVVGTKQVASFCAPAHPQIRKEVVMADKNNPGQFGNSDDTAKREQKGGEQSPGQFCASEGVDPDEDGKKGGEESPGRFDKSEGADPQEAGKKGGEQSPGRFDKSEGADPHEAG